jgi:hypothetical protein
MLSYFEGKGKLQLFESEVHRKILRLRMKMNVGYNVTRNCAIDEPG